MKLCNYRVYICLSANIDQLEIKLQKEKLKRIKIRKRKENLPFSESSFSVPSFSGTFLFRQPAHPSAWTHVSQPARALFLPLLLTDSRPRLSSLPSFLPRARPTPNPTPPRRRTELSALKLYPHVRLALPPYSPRKPPPAPEETEPYSNRSSRIYPSERCRLKRQVLSQFG